MNIVELNIREDFSFKWENFKVVIENCDMNIKKIGLFAIDGEIKSYQSSYRVSEDNPCQVNIPFDRVGEILSAYQRNSKFKVKSMTYGPSCLYVFTEPIHGW